MSDEDTEYAVENQEEIDNDTEEDEYDEDELEEDDEYDEAIENYARMLREVPQAKLDGIVERVEEIFNDAVIVQQYENDETGVYLFIIAIFILLTSAIVRGIIESKRIDTDYI